MQGSSLSIAKFWKVYYHVDILYQSTTKLCIPAGKFKTWMVDVLPQIPSNEKKAYNQL